MIGRAFLVIAVLATPALADVPSGKGGGQPGVGDATMDRTTFLALGASVTLSLAAGDTISYVRTGEASSTFRGVGLLAGVPLALWGTEHIGENSHDAASWAVTVASTGLVVYGLWPVVDHYVLGHPLDSDEKPRRSIRAAPIAIAGARGSSAPGFGVAATF